MNILLGRIPIDLRIRVVAMVWYVYPSVGHRHTFRRGNCTAALKCGWAHQLPGGQAVLVARQSPEGERQLQFVSNVLRYQDPGIASLCYKGRTCESQLQQLGMYDRKECTRSRGDFDPPCTL